MKNLISTFILLAFLSIVPFAGKAMPLIGIDKNLEKVEAIKIMNRLQAIKKLDKTQLSSAQKIELRDEVKTMSNRLHKIDGGLFISAGAIILILVVLIFLI